MWAPDRRRHLLDVASELLATRGLLALRMDALASAAGVSRPVVYEHFPGRVGLVLALYQDYADFLHQRTQEAVLSLPSPEQDGDMDTREYRVRAAVRAYFDCVEERGAGIRTLLGSTGWDPELEEAHREIWRRAIARWAEAIREFTGLPLIEAEAAASAMVASCWALIGQYQGGQIPRERAEEIQVQISLGAIGHLERALPGQEEHSPPRGSQRSRKVSAP